MDIPSLGRILITLGIILVVVGVVLVLAGKIPLLGRLPGDIIFRRNGFTLFFPIVTMVLVSLLLTIILNLVFRFFR